MFHVKNIIMGKFEKIKITMDQKTWERVITAEENGKVVNLSDFNIEDNRKREVVCIEGRPGIKRGEVYTVSAVIVYSCLTEVFLKEVNKRFNSMLLAEMLDYVAP